MKILKISLVVIIVAVILYFVYSSLLKKPEKQIENQGEYKTGPTTTAKINDSAECQFMKDTYGIIPGKTFGTAPDEIRAKWSSMYCYSTPQVKFSNISGTTNISNTNNINTSR